MRQLRVSRPARLPAAHLCGVTNRPHNVFFRDTNTAGRKKVRRSPNDFDVVHGTAPDEFLTQEPAVLTGRKAGQVKRVAQHRPSVVAGNWNPDRSGGFRPLPRRCYNPMKFIV